VLRIRAYKIVKKHYALMREIYKNNCVVKRYIRNKQLHITEQVFRFLKKKI